MTDAPPSPEEIKTRVTGIFSRSAHMYDTVIPYFATFAAKLVDAADLQPGERVLDVACGRGACTFVAAEQVGAAGSVTGIDLAEHMIGKLHEELAQRGTTNVTAELMDAERLDFPDESFDAVLCGFGVFFFPDPGAALAEVFRVLRPGGRFVASTFGDQPAYPWTREVARTVGKGASDGPKSPVAKTSGLEEMLVALGFEDVTSSPIDSRFVFPDVDAYVDWNWSHGGRGLLEQLDDEHLAVFRAEAEQRLQQHQVEDGYELVQAANATVARRPA